MSSTDSLPPIPRTTRPEDERPCGCWNGWHYFGFEGEGPDGELLEITDRVRCRRCNVGDED